MALFDAENPDPFYQKLNQLLAEAMALLTAVLAFGSVVGSALVLQGLGLDLFSLAWLGVVPIGAFMVGILSASGYYAGSLLFNVKPTKLTGWAMILIAVLAWAAFYFLKYALSQGGFFPVSKNLSGFLPFVDQVLRHLKFGMVIYGYQLEGSEMGGYGYAVGFVQLLALAAGGFIPYALLTDRPHCPRDGKFHQPLLKFRFPFKDDAPAVAGLRNAEEASRTYWERLEKLPAGRDRLVELELSRCPRCGQECLIERIFFAHEGKPSYRGMTHRFIWVRMGKTIEPVLRKMGARPSI